MAKRVSFSNLLKVITPRSKKASKQDTGDKTPVVAQATKGNNVEHVSLVTVIEDDMVEYVPLDEDLHFGSPLKRVPTPHPAKKNLLGMN
ncbi:hypothetical protein ASPCADRAFT_7998 [Aspergillus carbonarius ITEM 5010]|uniref:Uncharacterized protein n=1 Tax=Aspergillus carbonarius (strain ITEM 5010) TaxID=602072 RepID=A0A1R3REZ3_ASPC5|nr:hypothetical protein ASPCADRAFT_7998 [Aspergillus carbonarius ITEM 5010]